MYCKNYRTQTRNQTLRFEQSWPIIRKKGWGWNRITRMEVSRGQNLQVQGPGWTEFNFWSHSTCSMIHQIVQAPLWQHKIAIISHCTSNCCMKRPIHNPFHIRIRPLMFWFHQFVIQIARHRFNHRGKLERVHHQCQLISPELIWASNFHPNYLFKTTTVWLWVINSLEYKIHLAPKIKLRFNILVNKPKCPQNP